MAKKKSKKKTPMKKTSKKKPTAKKTTTKKPAKATKKLKKITKKPATAEKKPKSQKTLRLTQRQKKILEIKAKLIARRDTLLAEAEEALNELPGQTVFPDLGDQATAEIDRNFMLRLRGRERKLLKKIEDAIDRIDQGTFGICDKCGEEINIKRIEARPVTTMCIDCKTQQEEEEKLMEM